MSLYVVFPTSNSPLGFFAAHFSHFFERYYFTIFATPILSIGKKEVKETPFFFFLYREKL
jgi:hypothetical protein